MSPITIPVREASALLGIGPSTAYTAIRAGEFPVETIRIGGRIVVPVKPLLDLLGLDALPTTDDQPQEAA